MAHPRSNINPLWGERLKTLCDNEKITQKELSKRIFLSQQTISKIINGKASLTMQTAREIIKNYPQYRIEWLMGDSKYKNPAQQMLNVVSEMNSEGELLLHGLLSFAEMTGYTIACNNPISDTIEDFFQNMKEMWTISCGNESVTLSIAEMNRFENEVCDFVGLKLKHLIAEKGADNGKH